MSPLSANTHLYLPASCSPTSPLMVIVHVFPVPDSRTRESPLHAEVVTPFWSWHWQLRPPTSKGNKRWEKLCPWTHTWCLPDTKKPRQVRATLQHHGFSGLEGCSRLCWGRDAELSMQTRDKQQYEEKWSEHCPQSWWRRNIIEVCVSVFCQCFVVIRKSVRALNSYLLILVTHRR